MVTIQTGAEGRVLEHIISKLIDLYSSLTETVRTSSDGIAKGYGLDGLGSIRYSIHTGSGSAQSLSSRPLSKDIKIKKLKS
jgi:hypothetical protein